MFPLALAVADQSGVSPRALFMAVTFAASFGFATPVGYQTNLMIYGPGGYRFVDFLRIGVPLDILMWIVVVVLVPMVWH
jgi:di/tricarboxylate transporter